MAEILHFEILRKHGQTDMGITIPRPPPMGGEVTIRLCADKSKVLVGGCITMYCFFGCILVRTEPVKNGIHGCVVYVK